MTTAAKPNLEDLKPQLMQEIPMTVAVGYTPQAFDTSVEADELMFYLLRQRTSQRRIEMAMGLMRESRSLSLHCLKQQFGDLSQQQFARKVAEAWLQEDCPPHYVPTGSEMTWVQDLSSLARLLHSTLTRLSIPYYVTGGFAAIAYGEPRTTRDLDVVIAVSVRGIEQLTSELEAEGFYVAGMDDVIAGKMPTLQVTHMESALRADLVVASTGEWEQLKFNRRQLISSIPGIGDLYFASPEDVILNKLRWRQQSRSDIQWRDVLGILKVTGKALDINYLLYWATQLSLTQDLTTALDQAGLNP